MPSFPQHRNLKIKQPPPPPESQPVVDQTSQLPAISDIVSNYFYLLLINKFINLNNFIFSWDHL